MSDQPSTLNIVDVLRAFQGGFPLNLKLMRDFYGLRSLEVMPEPGSAFSLSVDGRSLPIHLPSDSVIGASAFLQKSWDAGKPKFLSQFAEGFPQGMALVEVGANVGLFSRQCLACMPNLKKAWCYEPHPANFDLLSRNVGMLSHVTLVNKGLSNQSGLITFYEDPNNVGNYSVNPHAMPAVHARSEVQVLDAAAQEAMWLSAGLPILYKSDTQGHDELIATTLSDAFWQQVRAGVMEVWRIAGKSYDRQRFASILDSFPFKVFEKNPTVNVGSADVLRYLDEIDGTFDDLLFWR